MRESRRAVAKLARAGLARAPVRGGYLAHTHTREYHRDGRLPRSKGLDDALCVPVLLAFRSIARKVAALVTGLVPKQPRLKV